MPTQGILSRIKNVIRGSRNPIVAKVQLAAVEKLKSGDLDLYVYEIRDQERLTHNARSWLPELQKGEQAKLLHKQYAILVHSAPLDFLPRERDVTETKEEILRENSRVIPDAVILYVGWATQSSKGNKRESSLLVAFDQPSHANKMLRGRFFLRGVALRTELYDPGLRIVQCRKCFFFGHVENCCTTLLRCPFCALAHRKEQCKILGMPHLSAPIASDRMPPRTKPAQSSANRRSCSNASGNRRRGSSRKHRRRKAPGPPPQTPSQTLTNLQAHVETQTMPAPISEWTRPGCTRSLAAHYGRPSPGPGLGPGSPEPSGSPGPPGLSVPLDNCPPTTPTPNITASAVKVNPANLTRPVGPKQTSKRRNTGGRRMGAQIPKSASTTAPSQEVYDKEVYDNEFIHIPQNDPEDSEYLPPRRSRVHRPPLMSMSGNSPATRKRGAPRKSIRSQTCTSERENEEDWNQDKDTVEPSNKRRRISQNGRIEEGINAARLRRKRSNKSLEVPRTDVHGGTLGQHIASTNRQLTSLQPARKQRRRCQQIA